MSKKMTPIYTLFDTFFSPPEICGKMSHKIFAMKSAVEFFFEFFSMKSEVKIFFNEIYSGNFFRFFFNEISSGKFFRFFFNEISSGKIFRFFFNEISSRNFFSMKSAVQMFFEFFQWIQHWNCFSSIFCSKSLKPKNLPPPMPQPTLVIFLSLLYLLSNVKEKSHVTFGGRQDVFLYQ